MTNPSEPPERIGVEQTDAGNVYYYGPLRGRWLVRDARRVGDKWVEALPTGGKNTTATHRFFDWCPEPAPSTEHRALWRNFLEMEGPARVPGGQAEQRDAKRFHRFADTRQGVYPFTRPADRHLSRDDHDGAKRLLDHQWLHADPSNENPDGEAGGVTAAMMAERSTLGTGSRLRENPPLG